MSSNDTRLGKALRAKLEYDMERVRDLLSGGALLNAADSGVIAIQYAKWTGHAQALQFAMDCIELAEEEMFGRVKDKKETSA